MLVFANKKSIGTVLEGGGGIGKYWVHEPVLDDEDQNIELVIQIFGAIIYWYADIFIFIFF